MDADLPGLTEKNFARLGWRARAAFAFRAAARVMPLIGSTGEGLSFWPETERARLLAAVIATLDAATVRLEINSLTNATASAAANAAVAVDTAKQTIHETASVFATTFTAALYAAASSTDASANAVARIAFIAYAAKDTTSVTMLWDLRQLLSWRASIARDDKKAIPPDELIYAPLWQRAEGNEPPPGWSVILSRWEQVMRQYGHADFLQSYMGLLQGRPWDVAASRRRLEAWYAQYQPDEAQQPALRKVARTVLVPAADRHTLTESVQASKIGTGQAVDTISVQTSSKAMPFKAMAQDAEAPEPVPPAAAAPPPAPEPEPPLNPGPMGAGTPVAQADVPAAQDHLGRTHLVNTVARMLASPQQPLPATFALLGDWGAGKSSFIKQLRARLDELAAPRIFTADRQRVCGWLHAEFNAWEYEHTGNIRAGLAQEVVNGLIRDMNVLRKFLFAFRNAWSQHRWRFVWSVTGLAMVTLAAVLASLSGGEISSLKNITGSFVGLGAMAVGAFISYNAWKTARNILEHPLASQLQTYLKLPDYGDHLGLIPVIKKQIEALVRDRLDEEPNRRLLVAVDDLDRCSPECIVETLDAIRLVMDVPGVAVLIAIDDRVAFRAVADHYQRLSDDARPGAAIARDYLGKIIQLPVNLPKPGKDEVEKFVDGALFPVVEQAPKKPELRVVVDNTKPENTNVAPPPDEPGDVAAESIKKTNPPTAEEKNKQSSVENMIPDITERMHEEIERADALMRDGADERDGFKSLAGMMGFNNPRLLIRLKNSYRLLKGVLHRDGAGAGEEDGAAVCEQLMCALFWYEYLNQLPLNDEPAGRRHAELIFWKRLKDEPLDEHYKTTRAHAMAERLAPLLRDDKAAAYRQLMRETALVVLPSAQPGVLLTDEELKAYREK